MHTADVATHVAASALSRGVPPCPARSNALVNADLGLTRKDINLIMSAADVNQDGAIEYAEFVPVALAVLTERLAQDLVHEAAWSSEVRGTVL